MDRPSETKRPPGPLLPPDKRVGFAIVGLGRLSLVSGDHDKASKIAAQYGIGSSSIYEYSKFDPLAQNREVKVIYVVLPNGMHEEYSAHPRQLPPARSLAVDKKQLLL
jgi:hypothetical protein